MRRRGAGVGFAQQTAFRVPASSIGYWTHRFIEHGVEHEALEKSFGEPRLSFQDPDGMSLALVGAFSVDEPVETLGTALKLPPFLEPRRRDIEAALPPLEPARRTV